MRVLFGRSLPLVRRAGALIIGAGAALALGCTSSSSTSTTLETLKVAATGTGTGTVNADAGGLSCQLVGSTATGTCVAQYDLNTAVTLTAVPATGSTFDGWSGGCSGSALTCSLVMTATTNVQADFSGVPHLVTLTLSGSGDGSVTSLPAGLSCVRVAGATSGTCSSSFAAGTSVLLTATPASQQFFDSWSGACPGSGPSCSITVSGSLAIQAGFLASRTVTITGTGSGSGTVASVPSGISCTIASAIVTGTCSTAVADGTSVTVTATPGAQQFFGSWTGGCVSSTLSCTFAATANASPQVSFLAPRTLTVSGAGVGAGTVTSVPVGVTCSLAAGSATGSCAVAFADATSVTLTAAASSGSVFASWSGSCAGVTCVVTMNAARAVTATFTGSSSTSQSTVTGLPLSIVAGGGGATITVTVRDAGGVALSGSTVTLSATGPGTPAIVQPSGVTNAAGVATGTLTATAAGSYTVTAIVNGTTTLAQQAVITVTAAAPASIAQSGPFNTTGARFGQAVATPPAVLVRDAFGNPVAGATVTFAVTKGLSTMANGATVSSNPIGVLTNGSGVAQLTSWTLASVGTTGNYSTVIDVNNSIAATVAGASGNVTFATAVTVFYASDVQPIWDRTTGVIKACNASGCHAAGGNLPLLTSPSRGNLVGAYLSPGDSTTMSNSVNLLLYRLVSGAPLMPQGFQSLPANVVGILRAYIRQGAPNN